MYENPIQPTKLLQSSPVKPTFKFLLILLLVTVLAIAGYFASAYYFNLWPLNKQQENTGYDKDGFKYKKGVVDVLFKNPDITPNEIQGFLDEYHVTLSPSSAEFMKKPIPGINQGIEVIVPVGEEQKYADLLSKSPVVKQVTLGYIMGLN